MSDASRLPNNVIFLYFFFVSFLFSYLDPILRELYIMSKETIKCDTYLLANIKNLYVRVISSNVKLNIVVI